MDRHLRFERMIRHFPELLFLCGLIVCLAPVAKQKMELERDESEYEVFSESVILTDESPPEEETLEMPDELPETVLAGETDAENQEAEKTAVDIPEETTGTVNLAACSAENPDFVAWLRIPGTAVSYPVVQSDNAAYYLHHLFSGKESSLGCLFSLKEEDYQTPGRNIAVFGHHIRTSDAMFSSLVQYKSAAWLEEHPDIILETLYGIRQYRIFAVVNYSVGGWDPSVSSFGSSTEFRKFLSEAEARSLYDTGLIPDEDEHILTLITCDRSYGGVDGRLAVMAVQIN